MYLQQLSILLINSEYESAMSDIEETMSVLSRRSRSTTPTKMMHRNPSTFSNSQVLPNFSSSQVLPNFFTGPMATSDNPGGGNGDDFLSQNGDFLQSSKSCNLQAPLREGLKSTSVESYGSLDRRLGTRGEQKPTNF